MFGIAGSRSRESGFDLYQLNLSRGCYSSSVTCIYPNGHFIDKRFGILSLNDIPLNAEYYLFHSRGPTVETAEFNWDDNHPFCYGRFIVSHNGIIENANELYGGNIGVDSRVVPYLIDKSLRYSPSYHIPSLVANVVSQLKGTFSLWIYDTTDKKIYITRNDTTLFNYGTEFSSSNPGYLIDVPQNQLLCFSPNDNTMKICTSVISTVNKPKYFIP